MDLDGTHSLTLVRIQALSVIQMWSAVSDNMECRNERNLNVHLFLPSVIHSTELLWTYFMLGSVQSVKVWRTKDLALDLRELLLEPDILTQKPEPIYLLPNGIISHFVLI